MYYTILYSGFICAVTKRYEVKHSTHDIMQSIYISYQRYIYYIHISMYIYNVDMYFYIDKHLHKTQPSTLYYMYTYTYISKFLSIPYDFIISLYAIPNKIFFYNSFVYLCSSPYFKNTFQNYFDALSRLIISLLYNQMATKWWYNFKELFSKFQNFAVFTCKTYLININNIWLRPA